MIVYSISKYNKISLKKLRRIALLIQGIKYLDALNILKNISYKGVDIIKKILISAGSNLQNKNSESDEEKWLVQKIIVTKGPSFKKLKMRARGRGDKIVKPSTHLMVTILDTLEISKSIKN